MRDVHDVIRESAGSGSALSASGVMIHDRRVVPRRWTLSDGGAATPGTIVPFSRWLELDAAGHDLSEVGAALENDHSPAVLKPYLARLPVVALRFPTWKDGRAYSQARKLRYLWGYRGTILAHGDVLRDQILWMSRVGFDALHLREDQDPLASLAAFSLYSAFYQY
jgi:uncharacterized protein (DUF934 family)